MMPVDAFPQKRQPCDEQRGFSSARMLLLFTVVLGTVTNATAQEVWLPAGRLTEHRQTHTATLLFTGQVLVVGGSSATSPLSSAELYSVKTGGWTTTGPLMGPRVSHTATLLPNGKVLVVGGVDGQFYLRSAELYDPHTGRWQVTGEISIPRDGHTATLLPDGKVLVVGGWVNMPLSSTELYDPVTGLWTSVGSLKTARTRHTATLLPSGKVLVTGGYATDDAIESAEIYDPATSTWTTTGSLLTARSEFTATLLLNGKVLVAGGYNNSIEHLSSTELYDPRTGTWSIGPSLSVPRYLQSMTLLPNGKVLVAGGVQSDRRPTTSAELYDPSTGVWSETGSLLTLRLSHTATLLPTGQVLVTGGSGDGTLSSTELYLPHTGNWTFAASLANVGDYFTMTLLPNGKVLVAGGVDRGHSYPVAELYNPESGTWKGTASMLIARSGHTATLLANGKVLVAGGFGADSPLSSAEIYDPATETWTPTGELSTPRSFHTATLLPNGKVLLAGGNYLTPSASAELYDPVTGAWSPTGALATGRAGHTATLLSDGQVLVVGGIGSIPSAELYDVSTGTWTPAGALATGRYLHTATLLPDGKVLVAGGHAGVPFASAELYDPVTKTWRATSPLAAARYQHTATLLGNGHVLVTGGRDMEQRLSSAETYDPVSERWSMTTSLASQRAEHSALLLSNGKVLVVSDGTGELYGIVSAADSRPILTSVSTPLAYGSPVVLSGRHLGGGPEATGGSSHSSAVNYALFELRSLENGRSAWLVPDARLNLWDDPSTVTIGRLPKTLDPGWYLLTPMKAGVQGDAMIVSLTCSLAITKSPQNSTVATGEQATFTVDAEGARHYQWERNFGTGWLRVGADLSSYTTEPVAGVDSGTRYRVAVTGACSSAISGEAVLTISDSRNPEVTVVSPSGGEYWLLSTGASPSTRVVTWSMSDDVRICGTIVTLLYSNDGGVTFQSAPAGGGLPATFGIGQSCVFPGVTTTSVTYTVPTTFPSGRSGSLYKIQVAATDHAGNVTTVTSSNPFYIVQANPESVRTLILWNSARFVTRQGISSEQVAKVRVKLQELANHPRVEGVVIDLAGVTTLQSLYTAWDGEPSNVTRANEVLFASGGLHEYLRTNLLATYSGTRYIVIVGDDRIIPMARLQDRALLLPESTYPAGGDLSATETTVGQALAQNTYLSDDPLAVLDPVTTAGLGGTLYLPDLSIGRLVETPQEMITTIATYISQDGILDLSLLNPSTGNKVLVTGYDFLSSVGMEMRARWKSTLRASTADNSTTPVDGTLIGGNWGLGSVDARSTALRTKLGGNGGARYAVMGLAGHATHYEEGVPGTDPFDIRGLSTAQIYGTDSCGTASTGALDLHGTVVYAVGCHGGLSVPGSCRTDINHSLDLPQTMLSRGVVAYVANTGYGWGLRFGIGYSARLVQIFTEQMTSRGTVAVGDLVRDTKRQYYLEAPRYDQYDEKTMMQWTLYGLPMYVVKTGIEATNVRPVTTDAASQMLGAVRVRREFPRASSSTSLALPPSLTQLNLSFDFTAPGVFDKHDSEGNLVTQAGCPDKDGCYYTLNGLVDRGTGSADLPVQPYLIYDSRLSGSSQHGVLWKGSTYREESGWTPVIGQLVSNGGDGSNHGPTPRHIRVRPTSPRVVLGADAPDCRTSDLEVSSMALAAAEAVKTQESDPVFSINRLYRTVDMEIFYFNNRSMPAENCDRSGPELEQGPFGGDYHQVSGTRVSWAIPAKDPAGIWRILVVYNLNTVDAQGLGSWLPLELTNDGGGTFRGSVVVNGSPRLTYMVQAVDNRGNVAWLEYTSTQLPSSGVPLGVPLPIDVDFPEGTGRRRSVRH